MKNVTQCSISLGSIGIGNDTMGNNPKSHALLVHVPIGIRVLIQCGISLKRNNTSFSSASDIMSEPFPLRLTPTSFTIIEVLIMEATIKPTN